MKVIVAEKPSVASSIAKVVGANERVNGSERGNGYLKGNGYCVTWCKGHLCELYEPQDYDERFSRWELSDLPIIPDKFEYKVKDRKDIVDQFSIVKRLINDPNTTEIVEATDAGREGELIFRLVYKCAGCRNPNVKRLWINSMEDDAILDGLQTMKSWREYDSLYASAVCRQRADWLLGMNPSRYYTLIYNTTLSYGRVQTVVVNMIVQRDLKIETFTSQLYYILSADMGNFKLTHNCETKNDANYILLQTKGRPCEISSVEKKEQKTSAPKLYNITDLQRECNRFFGFTGSQTMDYAQELYENKFITYPRTNFRYITSSDVDTTQSILDKLLTSGFYPNEVPVSGNNLDFDKIVNDDEFDEHTAIIPTKKFCLDAYTKLDPNQKKVMLLICFRLLMAVSPAYEYIAVKVIGNIGGYEFSTTGREDTIDGFKAFERVLMRTIERKEKSATALPSINQGDTYRVSSIDVTEAKTQPPSRYTEDEILKKMENGGNEIEDDDLRNAIKGKGLGTPATRSGIIDTIVERGYIERVKGKLISTNKGRIFVSKVPKLMREPELTAHWEKEIEEVRLGEKSARDFMDGIIDLTKKFFVFVNSKEITDVDAFKQDKVCGKCPLCGKDVIEKKSVYGCENKECKFCIPMVIKSGKISKKNARKILKREKSDVISGFIFTDKNTGEPRPPTSARLFLDPNVPGKLSWEFINKYKGKDDKKNG